MYAKPNTGMFKRCEKEHPSIKFSTGYYVGDKMSDLKVAMKMDATPILVRTGHGEETEKLLNRFTYKKIKAKTKIFDDLSAFVKSPLRTSTVRPPLFVLKLLWSRCLFLLKFCFKITSIG
jgi:histidinol phosphatase-like enzyme